MDTTSFPNSRQSFLHGEFQKSYFQAIKKHLNQEYQAGRTIYPSIDQIFTAFKLTPLDQIKVVIIGQDPYHGHHQAHGLAFSVYEDAPLPPSLRNIYKELRQEGFSNYQDGSPLLQSEGKISGNLTRRAEQGVFLLNSVLSVRAHEAASHRSIGREVFTDAVIKHIATHRDRVVYLLRGNYAKSKKTIIEQAWTQQSSSTQEEKGLILTATHPSPLSAHHGRFGNNHFISANNYLKNHGRTLIIR